MLYARASPYKKRKERKKETKIMNEQFSIAGKVAVITGAGGVLGGSIAKCFMQQGAKVVAVDIPSGTAGQTCRGTENLW